MLILDLLSECFLSSKKYFEVTSWKLVEFYVLVHYNLCTVNAYYPAEMLIT